MAKVKIQAGAELDTLSRDELRSELDRFFVNWRGEVARGIKPRRVSAFADVDGSGAVTLGESGEQILTPSDGFVWRVERLSITGYDPSSDALALYHSSVSDSAVIQPVLDTYNILDEIVSAGERLIVSGTATASTRLWVTAQVWEAPHALAWKLL
jgi:hypothetical protein